MTEKKELQKTDEKAVEFVPLGATQTIRLTAAMVRAFIAVPTRSGAMPSERDCVRFIMLCRGKRANPFEGDAFLIGYDTQAGPSFSMVCGLELFLKRAEQEKNYDGRESGIILKTANGEVKERPGCLFLEGETILGGWAKVYRKDHSHPIYKTVNFSVYNTGQSRWQKDPAGQIEKVASSQALRQAFPTPLGGLYTQEEMEKVTQTAEGLLEIREPIAMPKLKEAAPGATEQQTEAPQEDSPEPGAQEPRDSDLHELQKIFMATVPQLQTPSACEELQKKAAPYQEKFGQIWWFDFTEAIKIQKQRFRDKKPGKSLLERRET